MWILLQVSNITLQSLFYFLSVLAINPLKTPLPQYRRGTVRILECGIGTAARTNLYVYQYKTDEKKSSRPMMSESNGLTPLGKYCTTARLYASCSDWLREKRD